MMEFLSLYWIIGFALPPILFLLWNKWNLNRLTKRTMNEWKEKEMNWIRSWSPETTKEVEAEIKLHIDTCLQPTFALSAPFLLNMLSLPAISYYFQLGLVPNVGWLLSAFLLYSHLQKKAERLEKEGIPFRKIATHKRIKEELRMVTEYNDGIVFPYLFLKSYQRSIAILTEISEAIRTSESAEEGKRRVEALTLEEKTLVRDMNNAVMGRVPQNTGISKDNTIKNLLATIEDQSLPSEVRKKAMMLLNQMQHQEIYKPT